MDDLGPYFREDDGAVAEYDQLKANALELVKNSDAFVLVVGTWVPEEDDSEQGAYHAIITTAMKDVPPVPFMQQASLEVAKLSHQAAVQTLLYQGDGEFRGGEEDE